MSFYGALFGWEFDVWPAEFGHYTQCLLRDSPVAVIRPSPDPDATEFWCNVYFATDDCDAAVFGYTSDANPEMPELDFTFLRRPDGHEIGGIAGDPRLVRVMPRLDHPGRQGSAVDRDAGSPESVGAFARGDEDRLHPPSTR